MTWDIGIALSVWMAAVAIQWRGTWLARRHVEAGPPHLDAPFALYPISVLKPLKGADAGLQQNLESFFVQDYPAFELVFSVADPRDPACAVVRRLIAAYPHVRAWLIVGSIEAGPNPKVNNLLKSYAQASHDWLLISDSNVRVERDYLRRKAAHIDNGVGMITAVVAGTGGEGLAAELESVNLNTFYARGMYLAASVDRPCVMGKSMLFRRSEAERFGGLRALANYLAEDYMAGEAMRALGHQIVIAADPLRQHVGRTTFADYWKRHLRWGRIRKAQAPLTFLIEPAFCSLVSGFMGAWAFSEWLEPSFFIFLHLATWAVGDLRLMRKLGVEVGTLTPVAWLLRELSYPVLWAHIASGNSVSWRGQELRIRSGGLVERNAS